MEFLLILNGAHPLIHDEREEGADGEHQDTDDGAHRVFGLGPARRDLIEPGDEQVGMSRADLTEGVEGVRAAAGEEVDDVEVVDVADEGGEQGRSGDEEDVWHRDLPELRPGGRAVDARGFVEVLGDVHQDARGGEDGIRDTDPHVDQDDHELDEEVVGACDVEGHFARADFA